ncbi:cation diffusion facilitator family transporter [Algicola sagamiensis]|uniref:cation diffusion facilitator family transporter n=1 Tax=Algicola sagamiensis TaxID=163869 RepID=UPI00037F9D2B|nr:cation diffusion facilitator family transporter [Algicola sagamiensis]
MSQGADSLKSILYALAANFVIAIAKLAAAIYTGASSMLAESIHSFADCGNQGLLIYGLKKSKRPPSSEHPLGYGKVIYFWSFIVALMLFSMGGLFSIYEGIHKLDSTEMIKSPLVALGVLLFGIIAEGLSMYGCIKEVNKDRGDMSFYRWFRETRKSELMVIFGEDLAALLGLVFAFVALSMAMVTGNPFYDAIGSISIGVLLIVVAIFIGIEVKSLLVGQGVEPRIKDKMVSFLESQGEIEQVYNLVSLQMGNDIMVAIKAKMIRTGSEDALVANINLCESRFKAEFPDVVWLFFEPDIKD